MDRRKRKRVEQYQDMIARLYPELHQPRKDGARVLSRTVTFQVTEDCNLACVYCYQGHKTKKRMSFDTAKKAIDMLLTSDDENIYINPSISPAVILEFIGGEPFLEIDLIDQIVEYFKKETRRLHHPWSEMYCISICSNGVLYFDPKVQEFLYKNRNNISFSVTIDGNKELHDSCRVFPDGAPSYDLAVAAAKDWMDRGYYMGSKITIAPGNISFLYDALIHMIELGYTEINANCVYEEGWTYEHATVLYAEMKRVADYLFDHNLENDIYISLFEENFFKPKDPDDNDNWCFKAGTLITTPNGSKEIEDFRVGDTVISGFGNKCAVVDIKKRYSDDTIKITPYGMFPIYTTKEHPFMVMKNGPISYIPSKWVNASDIVPGDRVAIYVRPCGNLHIDPDVAYGYGVNGNMKQIPDDIFHWDRDSIYDFIKGYYTSYGIEDSEYMKIFTGDEKKTYLLFELLLMLGMVPECNKRDDGHILSVPYNRADHKYFHYDEIKRILWVNVSEVKDVAGYDVYNLTVEKDHTFIANGAIVHNCGGDANMLCIDPDGNYSVCIRYLPSSLGDDQPPLYLGHVDTGLLSTPEEKKCFNCMKCITRRSQSTDECFNCPIAEGCSWCFKAGTLITTPDGFKPIEEIEVGNEVITGSGNIKKVEKINTRYTNDTVEIKATGCKPIYTTSEHPFLVRKFRRSGNNLIYNDPQWVKASEIKKSDKIALFSKPFGDKSIDKEVAYIVGRYIGDGWKTSTIRGNCETIKYCICCSYEESEQLERHLDLANIQYYKDNTKRTAQEYSIYTTNHNPNDNNELLISIISKCGKYAYGKYIPNEVFNWDKQSIESFLLGYFDADGYYDSKRQVVKFTTVSELLAQGISSLLLMFGKKANWHIKRNSSSRIEGRDVKVHTVYELSFLVREPIRKYYDYDEENNIMWVNVKSVNTNIDGYEVYNMSVEDDHTYIANGVIVHNCSAYNYQINGTVDKRVTYICPMHKARALANLYFWNKYYRKLGIKERKKNYCPDEWALEIISKDELDMLKKLEEFENE